MIDSIRLFLLSPSSAFPTYSNEILCWAFYICFKCCNVISSIYNIWYLIVYFYNTSTMSVIVSVCECLSGAYAMMIYLDKIEISKHICFLSGVKSDRFSTLSPCWYLLSRQNIYIPSCLLFGQLSGLCCLHRDLYTCRCAPYRWVFDCHP